MTEENVARDSQRAQVLPLAHLGEGHDDLLAFYQGACACGEILKAALISGKKCLPPPVLTNIHQCAKPPLEFKLVYVGSGRRMPYDY